MSETQSPDLSNALSAVLTNACERPVTAMRPLRGLEVVLSQLGDTMGPDLIVGDVEGPLDFEIVAEAAFRLQQRHPTLRAAIVRPDGRRDRRPVFHGFAPDRGALDVSMLRVPMPGEPAAWRATHGAFWEWAAQEQSLHRFDLARGFLLRIIWVPRDSGGGGHVIVCSHHAVVDGTSLMRLLNQLLEEAAALHEEQDRAGGTAAEAAARLIPVKPMSLSEPLYSHLRFGWLEKAMTLVGRRIAIGEQKRFVSKPWLPLARGARVATADLRIRTECVFKEGEPAHWNDLHRQCKARGVTVGGAFAAAVQFAVARHLHVCGVPLPRSGSRVAIPLSMDYNMRTRVEQGAVDPQAIGLGTSIASVGIKVAPDVEFWELARGIAANARLQVKLRVPKVFQSVTDTIFDYPALLAYHGIDHAQVGGAGDGVNISNVGRYPFPTAVGSLRLRNTFGFNGACLSGPMFIFWLRQVDGHLCYNAMACSPSADRAMLSGLFGDVVSIMEVLAASEHGAALTMSDFARAPRTPTVAAARRSQAEVASA